MFLTGRGTFMQIMDLSLVSVFLRGSNEFFTANGAERSFSFVNTFDVDEQIGALTVRPFAHRALMPHLLVDALHVRRQHFPGIIHFLTVDALQFAFHVLDEAVIAETIFSVKHPPAFVAPELLLVAVVRVFDVLPHFGG